MRHTNTTRKIHTKKHSVSRKGAAKSTHKSHDIVVGHGHHKKRRTSAWLTTPRAVLIGVFALSFGVIGFYLLKNSFAATTPTTITVATWNVKFDNKKTTASQTKSILGKANVVGLQEVHTAAQRDSIRKLIEASKYAVSPKATTNNTSAAGIDSYPIVWRQKEFTRITEGATGQVSPGLDDLRPRYITWVKLQQNSTGKQFYVVNTHMMRDVEDNGSLSKYTAKVNAYTGHMKKLVSLIKKLQTDNVPIFVTGDFSMDYRKDTGEVAVFPKAALGAIGVKSNWELMNLKGVSKKAETYGKSSRLIDYVFAWNVTPQSTSVGGRYGSDHNAVFFKADLATTTIDTR